MNKSRKNVNQVRLGWGRETDTRDHMRSEKKRSEETRSETRTVLRQAREEIQINGDGFVFILVCLVSPIQGEGARYEMRTSQFNQSEQGDETRHLLCSQRHTHTHRHGHTRINQHDLGACWGDDDDEW